VRKRLLESGQWVALRTRPFSRVPAPDHAPAAIFVTAMDTHPLAADPALIIGEQHEAFELGLDLLAAQTDGTTYLCTAADANIPTGTAASIRAPNLPVRTPRGCPARTYTSCSAPVPRARCGRQLPGRHRRSVACSWTDACIRSAWFPGRAPGRAPRLLRTRLGVDLRRLCAGEMRAGDNRIISGSVLGGRKVFGATGLPRTLPPAGERARRGAGAGVLRLPARGCPTSIRVMGIYLSSLFGLKPQRMTTSTNGSERAMVPVGNYERVMPMDILPTQLLRSLIVGDTETAQALGCLELEEEDLALCTYVCPGKYEYGPILRDNLTRIEKEG
jgi:Na+-transporting NADH:ubiquinone oxidoreductase subunit A